MEQPNFAIETYSLNGPKLKSQGRSLSRLQACSGDIELAARVCVDVSLVKHMLRTMLQPV